MNLNSFANMFLFGVRKNICKHHFPTLKNYFLEALRKQNVCIFLYISLSKFFFKDVARFYLMVWGVGEAE